MNEWHKVGLSAYGFAKLYGCDRLVTVAAWAEKYKVLTQQMSSQTDTSPLQYYAMGFSSTFYLSEIFFAYYF